MELSEEQLRYGFYYYFKDRKDDIARVTEVSEYSGQQRLIINCTQLGSSCKSARAKKRVLEEWCQFLTENPDAFQVLKFGTRMPQELFEAVCHQQQLQHLEIKWGVYKDLSSIQNLRKLRLLYIGSGAGVESVQPISELPVLAGLYVENFQRVRDYSALADLKRLESLTICGDRMSPKYVKVDSIQFLRGMPNLRYLKLLVIRLQDKDYHPVMDLQNLEHLTLQSDRNVKKLYDELICLPNLKWGRLKENPELYG